MESIIHCQTGYNRLRQYSGNCQSGCAGLTGGSVIADGVVAPCVTVKLYPDPERSLVTKPSVFAVRPCACLSAA